MIMSDTQLLLSLPIIIVSFIAATIFTKWAVNQYRLGHIPTIGFSDPFLSWYSALRFLTSSLEILGEGYKKHKSSVYKIPVMDGWMVVAAGKQLIDDMRRAPDDTLGFLAASARLLEMKYTFGPEVAVNDRHADVIRAQLTRNTVSLFPDVYDEIVAAFNDIVPTQSDGGWVTFKTTTSLRKIICRASNRIFVGLPVCRDEDYVAVNIEFAMDVVIGSQIIKQFPTFIKSIVGAYLTKVPAQTRRVSKHLKSIIEERWRMMAEYGDNWQDRPNDLLQWHIDTAEGRENTVRMLAQRVLSVNFAAIHTTSQALTQTLYYVAECPEYADVMRDELQHVLDVDGWTKAAMGKLRKMDSFIKEAQRMDGLNALNLARWTLKPFTFSNGITVPANTLLIAAARGVHRDEEYYEDPDVFKPWRFANLREQEGQWTKHQFAATSTEFIDFGHGRHACPGRFFASSELKAILGHIILNYDVIFEDDTSYPPHRYISGNCIPADVNLLLRKRTT